MKATDLTAIKPTWQRSQLSGARRALIGLSAFVAAMGVERAGPRGRAAAC